ncbi:DUF3889 domain-containing protein [Paenibacillus sp. SAF-054]|uniref:DUF3889 domain-containing protein n=1 Tax=unclassified Paenibacillus TaxID=185978 RepID=UPI003F7E1DCE
MKKMRFMFLLIFILLFSNQAHAQPEYAKWGNIAVQETLKRYQASIIDYLHVGRTQAASNITEEKFKLLLRSGTKEFAVFVTIQFETSTERVLSVHFVDVY